MKLVTFSEQGHPVGEQIVADGAMLIPNSQPVVDADGRLLRPDGTYKSCLCGKPAFGGLDGRQPVTVPADADGLEWSDLAALKSEEHPFGLLKEARPETAAEKKSREKAEAEALAKAEAEAKAKAEAEEKARIAGISVTDYQLALALMGAGIITQDEAEAYVSAGAIPAVFEQALDAMDGATRAVAKIKIMGAKTILRSDPIVTALGAATGKNAAEIDALFIAASSL